MVCEFEDFQFGAATMPQQDIVAEEREDEENERGKGREVESNKEKEQEEEVKGREEKD